MATEGRAVGQTTSGGFQIGVRRTLPCTEEALRQPLTSEEGLTIWLGGPIPLYRGTPYTLTDGTTGELRVFRPRSHLRLTWQPRGWAAPATVQVRVLPAKSGATLSGPFHKYVSGYSPPRSSDGRVPRRGATARWAAGCRPQAAGVRAVSRQGILQYST